MAKIILLIILLLLVVILLLLRHIQSLPKYNIEDAPKEVPIVRPQPHSSSVIGVSTAVMLEPKPKPTPQSPVIPKDELDEAFGTAEYDGVDMDYEYDSVVTEDEMEAEDPISLDRDMPADNVEFQQKECLDYMQVDSASRAMVRGSDFTDEDKESLRKLRGTELLSRVLEQMNGRFTDSASDLINKLDLS